MVRVGGVERFKTIMTWLPTWSDAREILRSLGVSDKEVQGELLNSQALEHSSELLKLYELIAENLSKRSETVRQSTARAASDVR
jgi:hypothetical protein